MSSTGGAPQRIRRDHPFTKAFKAALRGSGLTQNEACRRAGISPVPVGAWLRGDRKPRAELVDRLAVVLRAPSLPDSIETRWFRIRMTCDDCGESADIIPGKLNARAKQAEKDGVQDRGLDISKIDYNSGTGSYICKGCMSARQARRINARIKKNHGKIRFSEIGQRRAAMVTPEELRRLQELGVEARRGRPLTAEHKRKMRRGMIRARPAGVFSLCRLCGLLVFRHNADLRGAGETHHLCVTAWRRENKLAVDSSYPPRPAGRRPSSADLAISYELAVRHLLRGERVHGWEHGRGLAAEFGLAPRTVHERIKKLIAYFPTDERATSQLPVWRDALLEASGGLPASN